MSLAKKLQQQQKVKAYIQSIPEFKDPTQRRELFRAYGFRDSETKMLEFYRKNINHLYKKIYDKAILTKHRLKSSFYIDSTLPYGIDNIISELVRRGQLIPLDQVKSREFYRVANNKPGWAKYSFFLLEKLQSLGGHWGRSISTQLAYSIRLGSLSRKQPSLFRLLTLNPPGKSC